MKTTRKNPQNAISLKRMLAYLSAVCLLAYCSCAFTVAGEPEKNDEILERARLVELLQEEAESEIQLEAWMLGIELVEDLGFSAVYEEEIALEKWMLDFSHADQEVFYAEIEEEALPLEDWMFGICCWDVNKLLAGK